MSGSRLYSARLTVILWRGGRALSRVVFKISAGFLVSVLILLAVSLYLSDHNLNEYRRLAAAGDLEGALQRARLAARLDPFSPDPLEALSFVLQLQNRDEEAADALTEATERDPHNYEPYLLLGCSVKKRTISLEASSPCGSVKEPLGLPPDQA